MSSDRSFGAWLKERRKLVDLTQAALAEQAGCSTDMVHKIESGIARPSRQLTELLLACLQVPSQEQPSLMTWARTGQQPAAGARSYGAEDVANRQGRYDTSPRLEVENPYKGLLAFQEGDAPNFFGREALTSQLISRLSGPEELSHFLAVVGPSGSGKSSVVRAGLLPALREQKLPGGRQPLVVDVMPGTHPLEEVEAAFLRVAVNPPSSLMEQLRDGGRGLARAVKRVLPSDDDTEMLLVIDQFEELFTLTRSVEEREALLRGIFEAVTDPNGRLWVVVTLRADFYDYPLLYIPSSELVGRRTEVVGPLTESELYRAITGPAERVGLVLEADLPAIIIADVAEQPGALPLMQYALTELYEQREGQLLTVRAYLESGSVLGSLARRAESLYSNLSATEQAEARQLFLRLVTLGEETGTEDTRRRVRRMEVASAARDEEALGRVLDLYGRYRMLTFDRDPLTGGPTVEVAHEALLRNWPRLRDWLETSREALRVHRRLMVAASEWQALGREPSYLASGARLTQFGAMSDEGDLALAEEEQAYLAASVETEQCHKREEQERQQRELALQKRSANRLRALVVGLLIFLLVAGGLALWALNSNGIAQANEQVAQADLVHSQALQLGSEANALSLQYGENQLVALLAIRSLNTEYTPEGDAALSRAAGFGYPLREFKGHQASLYSVALSPDGKYALTGSADKTARLWDVATGKQLHTFEGHQDAVLGVAYSPDGKYVATGSADATARIWDSGTGQSLHTFSGHNGPVEVLAFSHDGRYLLTGSDDTTARLWDISDRTSADWGRAVVTFTGHSDVVTGVAFSPDDKYVLTGSIDKTARLWDTATGKQVRVFSGHAANVDVVAYSPDGKYIATGSDDHTARIWDAATGDQLFVLTGDTDWVQALAFSPDGKFMMTGSNDKTARLWSVSTGQEVRRFVASDVPVSSVSFSHDGKYLLTASADPENVARLWSMQPPPGEVQLIGHTDTVYQASFSRDGKRVLTASSDVTARIWDAVTGQELRRFAGNTNQTFGNEVFGAVFSPDEKYVLTSGGDMMARLWDAQTAQQVLTFTGHTDKVNKAAFSPDGKFVVTASSDGTARVWDAHTGANIATFTGHTGGHVNSVAFSPDGTRVVTSGDDKTARIWDPLTGKELLALTGHTDIVSGVDFSPDGRYVVTGSNDGTARLWDAATGKELRQFLGHTGFVNSVRFSPDGRYVLTSGSDQTARLWNVATGQEIRRFVGHSSVVRDAVFSPDGKYIVTASHDTTARIWQTDYHDTINFLCGMLSRDLTDEERAQYNIADKQPTCPAR